MLKRFSFFLVNCCCHAFSVKLLSFRNSRPYTECCLIITYFFLGRFAYDYDYSPFNRRRCGLRRYALENDFAGKNHNLLIGIEHNLVSLSLSGFAVNTRPHVDIFIMILFIYYLRKCYFLGSRFLYYWHIIYKNYL